MSRGIEESKELVETGQGMQQFKVEDKIFWIDNSTLKKWKYLEQAVIGSNRSLDDSIPRVCSVTKTDMETVLAYMKIPVLPRLCTEEVERLVSIGQLYGYPELTTSAEQRLAEITAGDKHKEALNQAVINLGECTLTLNGVTVMTHSLLRKDVYSGNMTFANI